MRVVNSPSDRVMKALAWAGFSAAAAFWFYLLAGQKIFTAAMAAATPLLAWLRAVWSQSEDMSHGPLLPIVSLYALYTRRRAIRQAIAIGRPDGRGVLLTAAGLLLFWAGLQMEDVRLGVLALTLWTWTIPFALWGAGVARQLVFPCGYLLLSIPIDSLVIYFTMRLRLLAAALAVALVNGLGLETVRIGTGIHSMAGGGLNLDVAEPCSGLRSIFAMTALAGAYAFFTQRSLWKQWLLFLFAVPIAVVSNVVRIVAIVFVAAWRGEKAALGFYHDYSGYLVFLVALLLLVEIGQWIARWQAAPEEPPLPPSRSPGTAGDEPSPPPAADSLRGTLLRLVWIVSVPLLLAIAVATARYQPPIQEGGLSFLAGDLPERIGEWQTTHLWYCHNERCLFSADEETLRRSGVALPPRLTMASGDDWPTLAQLAPGGRCPACHEGDLYEVALGERQTLPDDTRIRRALYHYESGRPGSVTVTVVASGTGRHSIHRPELCIPAQGFVMTKIREGRLPRTGVPVTLVSLQQRGLGEGRDRSLGFAYTFFDGRRRTSSHAVRLFWTAWDRAVHRRASRWVMVTAVSDPGFDEAGTEFRLLDLLDQLLPFLSRGTPPDVTCLSEIEPRPQLSRSTIIQ